MTTGCRPALAFLCGVGAALAASNAVCSAARAESTALVTQAERDPCSQPGHTVCQEMPAKDLLQKLTGTAPQNAGAGIIAELSGVHIVGTLDLRGARLTHGLRLTNCRLDGIDLSDAQASYPISLACTIGGMAKFTRFSSTSSLALEGSNIESSATELDLYEIHLGGELDISQLKAPRLSFTNADLTSQVWLGRSEIPGRIELQGAHVGGNLVLDNVTAGNIAAEDARVDGAVMASSVHTKTLTMSGMRMRSLLLWPTESQTSDSQVKIEAANIEVAQRIDGRGLQAAELHLNGAVVAGDLNLTKLGESPTSVRDFTAANMRVGGDASMQGLQAVTVQMPGMTIRGALDLEDSKITGTGHTINMWSLTVGGDLDFTGSELADTLDLIRASVAGKLSLLQKKAKDIWLDDSLIGQLALWPQLNGELSLEYARAGTVDLGSLLDEDTGKAPNGRGVAADQCDEVPDVVFTGFTYVHLKDVSGRRHAPKTRNIKRLKCMLDKQMDSVFVIQPYRQLATVLRTDGLSDQANTILFEGNWKDMVDAFWNENFFDGGRSLLLLATIGWGIGIGYLNALGWAVFIVCIGAVLLYRGRLYSAHPTWTGSKRELVKWCVQVSLARHLPISLGDVSKNYFDNVAPRELSSRLQVYFVVHAILGYFIAACIAAGITGFTQAAS